MNKTIFNLTMAAVFALGSWGCSEYHPPGPAIPSSYPSQASVIEGQVVQADTDGYTVREASGRQTRVRVDRSTMRDNIAVGDYVIVRFAGSPPSSYATSIARTTSGTIPLSVAPGQVRTIDNPRIIEGTFVQQQGYYYLLRDLSGRDVRLHVDSTSRIDPSIRSGDRVVATVRGMTTDPVYARDVYRYDRSRISQRGEIPNDVILGEIVRTDDDRYFVRDAQGREVGLQVDNTTKLNRNIRAGDQVVAVNAKPATGPYDADIYSMYRRDTVDTIQGEVVRVDSDGYVVRDATGREVKFLADPATLRNGDVRIGDRVLVYTGPSPTMHADSIERRA